MTAPEHPEPSPGSPAEGAPPPSGGGGEGSGASAGLMIVLSYLGPLAVIPLLLTEDEDLRWHARHGLVLFGAELLAVIALQLVFGVVAWMDFGCTGCIAHYLFAIFLMVLHIVCIVKGLNGQRPRIPGVTALTNRF